jgi:insulysin
MPIIKPNILKSKNDKRDAYTYILPNKLRVFIIHDENADTACVAMMVKIGYFQDTIPGIAHFLEHMLFNGTKKYPDEKMFSSYISQNNGMQNAYTSHDHTCYFFTIAQEGLNQGLEMFGDFFVAPLLNKDCVDREKEAVDSEHKKNINDDNWRRQELLRVASHDKHWFSKFGTGSNETLAIHDIDIKVREFFEKYYSSDLMTLVVLTKEKIETIKNIVDDIFSEITIKKIKKSDLILDTKILKSPKVIKYLPIEDDDRLILTWEIPFFRDTPTQSPLEFLYRLIGNEQKNSLYDILTEKEYIIDFTCYVRDIIHNKCFLCIDIRMTPKGEKNKKIIIGTIMNYIELLSKNINKKILEDLYNEQLELIKYKFENFEKSDCMDTVLNLCSLVNTYVVEPENVFIIDSMQEKYSEKIKNNLKKILDGLTSENLIVIIGSKKYGGEKYKDRLEKFEHYGTEYFTIDKVYSDKSDMNLIKEKASLPILNKFISTCSKKHDIKNSNPILLSSQLYWMPNIKYNVPDICLHACINIQMALHDVYTDTCISLYLSTLSKEINDLAYMSYSALYNFNLIYVFGKIYIKLRGNHEKFNIVLKSFLECLCNYELITQKSFEFAKFTMIKEDKNYLYASPRNKVTDIFNKKICNGYYDSEDRLKIIDRIEKNDVIEVFKKIIPHNDIILFVAGNCPKEKALEIQDMFKLIPQKKHDYSKYKDKLYYNIAKREDIIIKNDNKIEENNANGFFIFIDELNFANNMKWLKSFCLLKILDNIISTEYFDELRTKEMYGYVVLSKIYNLGEPYSNKSYYLFLVQSPNKTTKEITERTEKFIVDFMKKINKITEEELEVIKNSFISGILTDFNNLSEMASFYFHNEIENKYLKYDFKEKIAEYCKKINLNDLIEFYKEKFLNNDKITNIQVKKI